MERLPERHSGKTYADVKRRFPAILAIALAISSFGTAEAGNRLGRFFGADSPWNQRLPGRPRLANASQSIIDFTWSQGDGIVHTPRIGGADYGFPVYYGRANDPLVRIHCREAWGRCAIEGRLVRIPAAARPAAASDSHLTVVNDNTSFELYETPLGPYRTGPLTIGYGTAVKDLARDSGWPGPGVTAAGASTLGGRVPLSELRSGHIRHALALATACSTAGSVAPATASASQECNGESAPDAAPLGSRFWLDLTPKQIARLHLSRMSTTLLDALHEYGAFMTDTNGESATIDLRNVPESPTSNPDVIAYFRTYAMPVAWRPGQYESDLRTLPTQFWLRHLHVVAPCVTTRRC